MVVFAIVNCVSKNEVDQQVHTQLSRTLPTNHHQGRYFCQQLAREFASERMREVLAAI